MTAETSNEQSGFTAALAIEVIDRVARNLEAAQAFLTELDSAIGDGDHGVSMTIGARAVRKELRAIQGESFAEILRRCGSCFQAAAGATVGALLGCALTAAADELDGVAEPRLVDLSRALCAANDRVKRLGGARVGDKTLIDTIDPAARALAAVLQDQVQASDALACMLTAARRGMESTREMVSTKGRASRLGERTRGHQDPGATSCYLILESIAEGCLKAQVQP